MPTKKNESKKYLELYLVISLGIIGVILLYWGAVNSSFTGPDAITRRGTFGDMFGFVNALFSGLALSGIIITIIMQMKELELTRTELSKTAKAQDESQKALNEQLKVMKNQSMIETLENHKKTLTSKGEWEKVRIANEVISLKTEMYLRQSQFDIFTMPRLLFISSSLEPNTPRAKEVSFIIQYKNEGASAIISNELLIPGLLRHQPKNNKINRNSLLAYKGKLIPGTYVLSIDLNGEAVAHRWSLEIELIVSVDRVVAKQKEFNLLNRMIIY